jgi:hypothetical protein
MGKPIVDLITDNLLTTLQGVTTVAGYHYTLTVAHHDKIEGDAPADKLCILYRGDTESELDEAPQGCQQWRQAYSLVCYAFATQASPDAPDEKASTIGADVCKALQVDYTRGGYAFDTIIDVPELLAGGNGIIINFACRYQTRFSDPFNL